MNFKTLSNLIWVGLICFSSPSFAQQKASSPCSEVFNQMQRMYGDNPAAAPIANLEEKKCLGTLTREDEVRLQAYHDYIGHPGCLEIGELKKKEFLGTISDVELVRLRALINYQWHPEVLAIAYLKEKQFLGTITGVEKVRLAAFLTYANSPYVLGIAGVLEKKFLGKISKSAADSTVAYLIALGRGRTSLYQGFFVTPPSRY